MKKQTLLDRRYPFWLALPAVIIFSVFFILPIIMGTGLSMTNWDMELDRIDFVGLRNYVNIFSDKYYWMGCEKHPDFRSEHLAAPQHFSAAFGLLPHRQIENPKLSAHHFLHSFGAVLYCGGHPGSQPSSNQMACSTVSCPPWGSPGISIGWGTGKWLW